MGVFLRLSIGLSFFLAISAISAAAEVPTGGRNASLHLAPTMFEMSKSDPTKAESGRSEVGSMVPDKSDLLGRAVKGIIYSLSLFGFLVWGYRRFRPHQMKVSEEIRVISRKTLAPRAQLLIVEVENKRLLLSMTSENLSLVTELASTSWEQMLSHEDVMLGEEMVQPEEFHPRFPHSAQGGR